MAREEQLQQNEIPLESDNAQLPPPQESAQENQGPVNEYDITPEADEVNAIQKELQDIEASIEGDFAKYITAKVNEEPDLEERFFSDREGFFREVIGEQNEFVKNLLEPRVARLNELNETMNAKAQMGKIDAIAKKFQAEHPDVNLQELIVFFTHDLPLRIQEQIKEQPQEQFFDLVYQIYAAHMQQMQPPPPEEPAEPELPKQAQGVPVSNDQAANNANMLPLDRY